MTLLAGKRALIFGLASRHSLAYKIAVTMKQAGADVAISYQKGAITSCIQSLIERFDISFNQSCDVTEDKEIEQLFTDLQTHWDGLDILVHAIAHAPPKHLADDYLDNTTRAGFHMTHDISSYSFLALAKYAKPMLRSGGVLLTLSYLGAERVVPHYNVMGVAKASLEANMRYLANSLGPLGIRVNAISPGPIQTIAASQLKGFKTMLAKYKQCSPLRQLTSQEQVAHTAVCLCSDWMAGVTGEVIHVDNGFHILSR